MITEVIVKRAVDGDDEAFKILYEDLYKDMYRIAYYKLQNVEDAEDVVSDAVFDMYRGIHKLKDLTAYRAWAMRILNVKCSIKMKEYYINRTEDIEELDCQSLENVESESVLRTDIKKALDILSDEEKTIVLCSAVAGMSSDEISEMINLNSNTIRSKLSRALLKLRNCKCFKYDY
ncbi:MAG: RNA polymerase sigma factor [Lachnospiraceae bacterium]|nr:RNA polymerase sigma factor [Lachnospiraceae bacterium]